MAELQELQDIFRQQGSTSPFSERQLFQPEQTHCNKICSFEALDNGQNRNHRVGLFENELADILTKCCDKPTFNDLCSKINDFSTENSF